MKGSLVFTDSFCIKIQYCRKILKAEEELTQELAGIGTLTGWPECKDLVKSPSQTERETESTFLYWDTSELMRNGSPTGSSARCIYHLPPHPFAALEVGRLG